MKITHDSSMIFLLLLATAPAAGSAQSDTLSRPVRELVVKDFIGSPLVWRPGVEASDGGVQLIPDLGGDSVSEHAALFRTKPTNQTYAIVRHLTSKESMGPVAVDSLNVSSPGWLRLHVFLRSPHGLFVTAPDGGTVFLTPFPDLHPRTTLSPPLPSTRFASVEPAGDVDGDGYDDFFFYGDTPARDVHVGLMSGRTQKAIWTYHNPSEVGTGLEPSDWPATLDEPDLNGDGIREFITSHLLNLNGILTARYRAFSGADGAVLWERSIESNGGLHHAVVGDLTSDGVPDLIHIHPHAYDYPSGWLDPGLLLAMDGHDGSVLWQSTTHKIDPDWAHGGRPFVYRLASRTVAPMPDVDGDGTPDLVFAAERDEANSSIPTTDTYALISGASGRFLERIGVVRDGNPWFPDPVSYPGGVYGRASLQDSDGDGWPEFATRVALYSREADGLAYTIPFGRAILTFSSLQASHTDSRQQIEFRADLPKLGGGILTLLASTRFSRASGLEIDGWNTCLGASAPLSHSLAHPIRVPLDVNGQGSGTVPLPPLPPGYSEILYLRGIVSHPGLPAKRPTRMTTLAQVELGK